MGWLAGNMVQRVPICADGTSDRIFRIEVICIRLLQISLLDGVVPLDLTIPSGILKKLTGGWPPLSFQIGSLN